MRFATLLIILALSGGQDLGKFPVFPADNPWNWDIRRHAVHPDSAKFVESIGPDRNLHPDFGRRYGIPYCVVTGKQKMVGVDFEYADESDPGPYPIPDDAPVEGGADAKGDRHILVVDRDRRILYELFNARKAADGWKAGSGAIFKLDSNDLRPEGWTSADAAGLPIFPGLARFEEVERGEIPHALRFTVRRTQRAFLWPARHFAGSDKTPALPPMGLRFRLKADVPIRGFPKAVQVILRALQKHGMIVADNGSDWFISGAPDPRWDDEALSAIKRLKGRDFEAVLTVDAKGRPIPPGKK